MNIVLDNNLLIAIVTVIIVNIISPFIIYRIARKKIKDDFYNKALQNRYKLIYVPLRTLLLGTHISSSWTIFGIKYRIKRSLGYLMHGEILNALKSLSNSYGSKPVHGVDFGDNLPFEKIKEIITKNSQWADSKILNLIQMVDRSKYENHSNEYDELYNIGLLEKEEFELYDHIFSTYHRYNQRLMPETY